MNDAVNSFGFVPEIPYESPERLGRRLLSACKRLCDFPAHQVEEACDLATGLLRQGAPTSEKDHKGRDPLHLAVDAEHMSMIEALIHAGADLTSINHYGNSAFARAAFLCSESALRLLAPGSDVNHISDNGKTPLMMALNNVISMHAGAQNDWAALRFLLEISDLSIGFEGSEDPGKPMVSLIDYAREAIDGEPLAIVERAVGAAEAKNQAEEIELAIGQQALAGGKERRGLAL